MKRKRILIVCAIALLAAGLAAWRLWPRSLSGLIGQGEFEQAICKLSFYQWENTASMETEVYLLTYRLYAFDQPELGELTEILRAGQYREDFRNLLPWGVDSLSGHDSQVLYVTVGHTESGPSWETCNMTFFGSEVALVDNKVIHPSEEFFERLKGYVQSHGELEPSARQRDIQNLADGALRGLEVEAVTRTC